ncbi:MAG: hypothetical protein ABSA90_11790 [Xanthobacteraceae bacterium]
MRHWAGLLVFDLKIVDAIAVAQMYPEEMSFWIDQAVQHIPPLLKKGR